MERSLSCSSIEEMYDEESIGSTVGSESDLEKPMETTTKRSRKLPARFRDSAIVADTEEHLEAKMRNKKVCVKCNQTGKVFKVDSTALTRGDDESMTMDDLVEGSQLLLQMNKKSYPVTVRRIISVLGQVQAVERTERGKKEPPKKTRKRELVSKEVPKPKKLKAKENILQAVKAEFTCLRKSVSEEPPAFTTTDGLNCEPKHSTPQSEAATDRVLLLEIKEMLTTVIGMLKQRSSAGAAVKEEIGEEYIVDGVNLLRIPAKDAYSYGRALLDQLFTKQEQKVSVVLKTKKSEKPPLSPPRVEKMFDCIQRRYGTGYDHKTLMVTLNQKCRDAKPVC